MAKTLDKKFSSLFYNPQSKLIKLRKKHQWAKMELSVLPETIEEKKQAKLSLLKVGYDKKLAKSAFLACDKQKYADDLLAEKMQAYDVKAYMQHRAVNHGFAKAVFKALSSGESYAQAMQKQKEQQLKLRQKREEYLQKLLRQNSEFVKKHSTTSDQLYNQLKASFKAEYAQTEKQLAQKYNAILEQKTAVLKEKIEKIEEKIKLTKEKITANVVLDKNVVLSVKGLKMYFGGLKAVDDLTFDVYKGEIFGLIGPNGAGKTTVFNCITRFYDATEGDIYFENKQGEVVNMRDFKVHDVILQGISRTFQNVELVKEITVLENLLVACTREYQSNFWIHALGLPIVKREDKMLKTKALKILKFMGIENYAGWYAMGLPYGILKKVEIARALMSDAKLIIMDEPAAGLNDTETAELTQIIRKIRDEFDVTILLVEHDMKLVMSVCDTVCAISFGKMLAIGTTEQVQNDKAVQEAYLGVEED